MSSVRAAKAGAKLCFIARQRGQKWVLREGSVFAHPNGTFLCWLKAKAANQ